MINAGSQCRPADYQRRLFYQTFLLDFVALGDNFVNSRSAVVESDAHQELGFVLEKR